MLGLIEVALVPLILLLFAAPLALAAFAFWIWMLVHATQNKGLGEGEKVAWVLIKVMVQFLGAVIYCFVGKPKSNQAVVH